MVRNSENLNTVNAASDCSSESTIVLLKRGFVLIAVACGVLGVWCRKVLAMGGAASAGYGVIEQCILSLRGASPKLSQLLRVFKDQGLILALLLGLSAFFSMAETSITTLWPWKV